MRIFLSYRITIWNTTVACPPAGILATVTSILVVSVGSGNAFPFSFRLPRTYVAPCGISWVTRTFLASPLPVLVAVILTVTTSSGFGFGLSAEMVTCTAG
jgi:hypothetical protein